MLVFHPVNKEQRIPWYCHDAKMYLRGNKMAYEHSTEMKDDGKINDK